MSTIVEMLPLLYNNMEGSSNGINSLGQYEENVILNCVRSRKKVTELPNCPVCSCTIRHGELDTHVALEIERLHKLSTGSKRKLSVTSSLAVPGPSTSPEEYDVPDDQEVDVTGCLGSDVYQRVHGNRLKRLRSRRSPTPQGQCPVCTATLPVSRLQRHTLRCLKRTGASVDEDIPPSSEEEGTIDVENDEEGSGSGFGTSYRWCGEWRVRAAALQHADARVGTCVRRASNDQPLVVDGDEDTELYGPPQYSPSRIAPDAEMSSADSQAEADAVIEPRNEQKFVDQVAKSNGLVEASAETRIQALKAKIKDLEKKQNGGSESKCLICLGPYISPAVSIQCWHVYCEECWLQSLHAKKICPQCNVITSAQHLRRIYM